MSKKIPEHNDPEDRDFQEELSGQEPRERPNKSQLKREMQALREQAVDLLSLKAEQIKTLDIDQSLSDAIDEYKRIKQVNAQKRHAQFVTKILSEQGNLDEILEKIEAFRNPHLSQRKVERSLEKLLPELLSSNQNKIDELLNHPDLQDRQHFLQLLRNAQKEVQKADADNGTAGKHQKKLKEFLRQLES